MASRDSFKKMMENWYIKDELNDIPSYTKDKNIELHLKLVTEKLEELQLSEEKKTKCLLKSLSEDVTTELKSLPEFDKKKDNYQWICDTLKNVFHENQSLYERWCRRFNCRTQILIW